MQWGVDGLQAVNGVDCRVGRGGYAADQLELPMRLFAECREILEQARLGATQGFEYGV